MGFSRRDFITTTAFGSLALSLEAQEQKNETAARDSKISTKRPIIICANNGFNYLDEAYAMLRTGRKTIPMT
ncbi:MAG: hypothetical protein DMG68_22270 [Acidobacteria bacterium]|nr:MAG: hypothetical protein DMG68_22270 [Acidobacteriota bacterium]